MCRIVSLGFALLYAGAVFVFLTGTFGWFGQPTDPLSAVFLLPLGLPWVLGLDLVPETARAWVAGFMPLLNLAILVMLCRRAGTARSGK